MANTLNQSIPIDTVLPPSEIDFLKKHVPHLVEFMRGQTTLITQLSIRVGGSGSGSGIVDLGEITEDVADLTASVDALDEQASATDSMHFATEAMAVAEQALTLASTATPASDLLSRVEALEYAASDLQLLAEIYQLRQRIEALENVSNA